MLGAVGIWMRSMSRSMAAMFFQDRFICFIPQLQMERSMLSMKRRRMSMSKYSAQSYVFSIVDKVVNIALRSETNPYSSRRDVFLIRAALSSDCPSFSLFHNSPQLCCVWARHKRNSGRKHSEIMQACLLISRMDLYFLLLLIFTCYFLPAPMFPPSSFQVIGVVGTYWIVSWSAIFINK